MARPVGGCNDDQSGPHGASMTLIDRYLFRQLLVPTVLALAALVAGIEADGPSALVVDLIEQGLDQASQAAVIAYLRRRVPNARPLFLMTRSNVILDLEAVGPDEAILLCPANHSPPTTVAPYPGAAGYEAVATCLAPPDVRARTDGVVAMRPVA